MSLRALTKIAMIGSLFGTSACGVQAAAKTDNVSQLIDPDSRPIGSDSIKMKLIEAGSAIAGKQNGIYSMSVDARVAGTARDLKCVLIRDWDGMANGGPVAMMDCDWESANKANTTFPMLVTPAP